MRHKRCYVLDDEATFDYKGGYANSSVEVSLPTQNLNFCNAELTPTEQHYSDCNAWQLIDNRKTRRRRDYWSVTVSELSGIPLDHTSRGPKFNSLWTLTFFKNILTCLYCPYWCSHTVGNTRIPNTKMKASPNGQGLGQKGATKKCTWN